MPRPEDIERFAEVLASIGDEPAIRAARSQAAPQAPPPEGGEAGAEPALDALPGSAAEGPGTEEQADLLSMFDTPSPEEPSEGPATEPAPEPEPGAEAPGTEGLDFGSLFGEESAPQGIEDIDQPLGPAPEEPSAGAAVPEDEFSLPEGQLEGLQSDLTGMESVPETPAEPPSLEPAAEPEAGAEPGTPEPGSFEDLDAFAFDAGETPAATEQPEAGGEPAEPSAPDLGSTELPSLDDLSFAEAPSAAERAAEAPATEEPAPSEVPTAPEDLSAGGFDLDTMSLPEEPGAPAAGEEPPGMPPAEEQAPGAEVGGTVEEPLGDLDEFSLPESAGQFRVPQAPPTPRPAPRPAARRGAAPPPPRRAPRPEPGAGEEAGEVSLTPEQFARLKATLEALPRNLKIAVQDVIGQGTAQGADLARLVRLLVEGAAAQEIATLVGRITGKRIRVPAGYEKKTGEALEAEQRTFGYAFRQNILPLVRVVAITLIAGALFGFLGYRYIYRPLSALGNYRAGYAQIQADHYAVANERFNAATAVWPMKTWYFRYAEGFSGKRQYVLAEEKYEQLLAQFGFDKRALLEYAGMESASLADYAKADGLLQRILDRSLYDYDALLATGDNDILWADTDPTRLQAARLAYATLLDRYGVQDTLLFRMLRYFIRADNGQEVERLRAYYATKPEVRVDPGVYAELGGYLIDHRRMDNVQQVLFRADKVDPTLWETHYQLARYYRIVGRPDDEKLALDQVVTLLARRTADPLTRRRLTVEIDTHTRLGEWLYRRQRYVEAGNELRTSIDLIERNQAMKLLSQDKAFGRPYAQLGDLYYYIQGDLDGAEMQYRAAIANLYSTPAITYKIGFIQYARGDWKDAVTTFIGTENAVPYPVADDVDSPLPPDAPPPGSPAVGAAAAVAASGQVPENLLYALGNAFYQRGDYFAAQGYYLRLLSRLETRRDSAGLLQPDVRPADKDLLVALERTDNNLGVTLLKLSQRTGDRSKRAEGLVSLTNATEISDSLARNLSSTQRSPNASLASLNMRAILHPTADPLPGIDPALPRDLTATEW